MMSFYNKTLGTQKGDPEVLQTIAEFKRLADLWRLDASFREAFRHDPEKAIAGTGMKIDPEAFLLYAEKDAEERRLRDI